jgi:hypothetical protein
MHRTGVAASSKKVLVVSILFCGMVIVLCASGWHWLVTPRIEASDLEKKLQAALPIGTSRAEVETWLREHRWRYQNLKTIDGIEYITSVRLNTEAPIDGISFMGTMDIEIRFYFDKGGDLSAISAKDDPRF